MQKLWIERQEGFDLTGLVEKSGGVMGAAVIKALITSRREAMSGFAIVLFEKKTWVRCYNRTLMYPILYCIKIMDWCQKRE